MSATPPAFAGAGFGAVERGIRSKVGALQSCGYICPTPAARILSAAVPELETGMAKDHLDAEAVRAAQGVLDAFMKAFNARDIPAFEDTFNFPSVRLASQG